jgi:hypothetical protein
LQNVHALNAFAPSNAIRRRGSFVRRHRVLYYSCTQFLDKMSRKGLGPRGGRSGCSAMPVRQHTCPLGGSRVGGPPTTECRGGRAFPRLPDSTTVVIESNLERRTRNVIVLCDQIAFANPMTVERASNPNRNSGAEGRRGSIGARGHSVRTAPMTTIRGSECSAVAKNFQRRLARGSRYSTDAGKKLPAGMR